MATQPSITDEHMVVAEIINEINSAQPQQFQQQFQQQQPQQQKFQQQPQQQQKFQQQPQQPQQQQKFQQQPQQQQKFQQQPQQQQKFQQQPQQPQRGTPINRPVVSKQDVSNRGTPIHKPTTTKENPNNFIARQKERMKNRKKKVQFKDEIEEFEDDDDSDNEKLTMKRPKATSHKFLSSTDVEKNDLTETKGLYSSVMGFFTKDTKEPLVVMVLVFAVSLPLVAKLMHKFLPFLMKNGDDSFLVLGFKALLVAIVFFAMKKLLL